MKSQFKKSILLTVSLSVWISLGGSSTTYAKPKYGPEAMPLSTSHEYFKDHFPPLFWKMMPYYIPQYGGGACAIASGTMAINASRAVLKILPKLTADDALVTEEDFLKFMKDHKDLNQFYQLTMKRGTGLQELATVLPVLFKHYKVDNVKVEAFEMIKDSKLSEKRKHLHELLEGLEKSDRHIILINFIQGVLTGDADIGHFSPIAAYDSKNKKALIFDTDRKYYEPYWVSEEALLKSIETYDKSIDKYRGFIDISL